MDKPFIRLFIYNPALESQPDDERRPVARDHKGKWWAAPWSRSRSAIKHQKSPILITNSNVQLKLKDRIRVRNESFGGLLFDPYSGLYYEVDSVVLPLLNLLKTPLTVDEIINSVSEYMDSAEVRKFLNELAELSLIDVL